jgi:hypothetical protein
MLQVGVTKLHNDLLFYLASPLLEGLSPDRLAARFSKNKGSGIISKPVRRVPAKPIFLLPVVSVSDATKYSI